MTVLVEIFIFSNNSSTQKHFYKDSNVFFLIVLDSILKTHYDQLMFCLPNIRHFSRGPSEQGPMITDDESGRYITFARTTLV